MLGVASMLAIRRRSALGWSSDNKRPPTFTGVLVTRRGYAGRMPTENDITSQDIRTGLRLPSSSAITLPESLIYLAI